MLIFTIQILLLFFLVFDIVSSKDTGDPDSDDGTDYDNLNDDDVPELNAFFTYVTKFFCSVILHINQQPKVYDAIKRIQYIQYHPHKFDRITIPIVICLMKLVVELGTETVSLILTASYNTVANVISNFITMICVSQLDEMYFLSIRSVLKDELK